MDIHNLEFIKVEPETPFETEWVQSFIKIGRAWELFTKEQGGTVSGLLSAFGIQLESHFSLKSYKISIEVLKRITDVNAGNLVNEFYTYATTIKIDKPFTELQHPFKVRSQNWIRLMLRHLNSYKKTRVVNGFIYYGNSKEQLDKLIHLNLNQDSNFGWIKRSNSDIVFKFYNVEDTIGGINKYVEILKKLIKDY